MFAVQAVGVAAFAAILVISFLATSPDDRVGIRRKPLLTVFLAAAMIVLVVGVSLLLLW